VDVSTKPINKIDFEFDKLEKPDEATLRKLFMIEFEYFKARRATKKT